MHSACKYLIIVCVNVIIYYRSLSCDFVFDDSVAVVKNRDVSDGFTPETFKVSFINENFYFLDSQHKQLSYQ